MSACRLDNRLAASQIPFVDNLNNGEQKQPRANYVGNAHRMCCLASSKAE